MSDEKEILNNPKPIPQAKEKFLGPKLTFEEALEEGAQVLHDLLKTDPTYQGFGKVGGDEPSPDVADNYDAREWEEIGREKLVAKVESWQAFDHLLKNANKEVPSSTGGTTRWRFDCLGFVIINRIYAHWRTMTREEFNLKYTPLELGMQSKVGKEWESPGIEIREPGERPYQVVPEEEGLMSQWKDVKTFSKSMKQLVLEAPVGSWIIWRNVDAINKCSKDPSKSFCTVQFENATKLGPDKYSAHNYGVVNEEEIKQEMAKAVLGNKNAPKGYIQKYIFVSDIHYPKKNQQAATN